jgi:hypothetical protein
MRFVLHPSNLIPPGFVADSASSDGNQTLVMIHANRDTAACPACCNWLNSQAPMISPAMSGSP